MNHQAMKIFFLNKLYTDASIRNHIGLGAYIPYNVFFSISIPGKKDINRAELAAIYIGLLIAPPFYPKPLLVYSDSITALNLLYGKSNSKKYDMLIQAIHNIAHVKYGDGLVQYHKVKGHSGIVGNEIADLLARQSALIPPDLTVS